MIGGLLILLVTYMAKLPRYQVCYYMYCGSFPAVPVHYVRTLFVAGMVILTCEILYWGLTRKLR